MFVAVELLQLVRRPFSRGRIYRVPRHHPRGYTIYMFWMRAMFICLTHALVSFSLSVQTRYKPIPLKGVKSVEVSAINGVSNATAGAVQQARRALVS